MSDLEKARENPADLFWDELDDVNAGMLGVVGAGQHYQPMAPYCDRKERSIWFFTSRDSDILKAVDASGGKAMFNFVADDRDFYACAGGTLIENTDREKVEEFWNPIASAWYEDGKNDPNLALLQLKLEDAAIWASSGNPVSFAWQIAKANLTDDAPDMGERNHIRFAA